MATKESIWGSVLAVATAGFLLVPTVLAAQETLPTGALSISRTSSEEVMQRPVELTLGAGRLHQRVSTDSAEAQAFYDQGISYLHSYVWVEAARSFHQALRHDPGLAMAHLGLAKAYSGATAYRDAFRQLKKAATLAEGGAVTEKESRWIALGQQQMDAIFSAPEERSKKHQEYQKAIEELIALDPDDAHAWVLRGNAAESRPSGRGQGGRIGSIAFYDAALARDPHHFGAHHYLVHSYEGLGLYQKSAQHAAAYAAYVPGVPHAQHMYAHVLPRLGQWEKALSQLARADELQRGYFDSGVEPVEEWHHGHNIHLMGAVELRRGNFEAVERFFKEAFYLKVRAVRDGRHTDPWLLYLLLRGRYGELLEAARDAEARPQAIARVIGAARAAEALLAMGRREEARQAQKRMLSAFEQFRQDTSNPIDERLQKRYEEQLIQPLEAQFALLGENPEEGEAQLLQLADGYTRSRSLDGWLTGLIRLEQLAGLAQRLQRSSLVEALQERIHRIDPDFPRKVGELLADTGD